MKFGKLPPEHDKYGRTLRMADYIDPSVPVPPLERAWTPAVIAQIGNDFGDMGNDEAGNCVYAAQAHMCQVWTANDGTISAPTRAEALQAYSDATGYVPGDPSTDRGDTMLNGLRRWQQKGFGGRHKILAYGRVDPNDKRTMAICVDWFGGLYAGLMLPDTYGYEKIWQDVTSAGRYGHAVNISDRNPFGVHLMTWARLKEATGDYIRKRCDELFAVVPERDWTGADGRAPNGFLLDKLLEDLHRVTK